MASPPLLMNKITLFLAIIPLWLSSFSLHGATTIVETFSGSGSLTTPGNTGDHTGNAYTLNVVETVGCAQISFDVTIEASDGPLHFDSRGFGDSAGADDSMEPGESMTLSISNFSASAIGGATLISNAVLVQIRAFDLVNDTASGPVLDWNDNLGNSGTAVSTGTASGDTFSVSASGSGVTKIETTGVKETMWLNNLLFQYRGNVTVEKPDPVPEPASGLLILLSGGLLAARRRRA